MALVGNRLIRGVTTGGAVGADELGRCLSERQQAFLVERLTEDVVARGNTLLAEARAQAAAIVARAGAEADAMRERAYAEGFAAGQAQGNAAALAELQPCAALLRQATDAAAEIRAALLAGLEEQAIGFALAAARKVIGTAAEDHAALAAQIVRAGIRSAAHRVVRVRVNPEDEPAVSVALIGQGSELPVHADAAVELGGCILDVEGGTVDLQLGSQLAAIEHAFAA